MSDDGGSEVKGSDPAGEPTPAEVMPDAPPEAPTPSGAGGFDVPPYPGAATDDGGNTFAPDLGAGLAAGNKVPRATLMVAMFAGGMVIAGLVAFYGYPSWVGTHLRHVPDATAAVVTAAALCAVFGLAIGITVDSAAMRREGISVGMSPLAWGFFVIVLAIVAVPYYLVLRTNAIHSPPLETTHDGLPGGRVGAAVALGLLLVAIGPVVVVAASVAARPAFGIALDEAKVESAISARTPNNNPTLQSIGVSNISCSVKGLVHKGDTFTCSEDSSNPLYSGFPAFGPTTTNLIGLSPQMAALLDTHMWTVTVTDDNGSVSWVQDK